jgi:sugar-specific transcriptional regulator TrmB
MEKVMEVAEKIGFSETDAKVYFYLAKNGPMQEKDLARALKVEESKVTSSLTILVSKGIVKSKFKQQRFFSALAFEKVLESTIKQKKRQVRKIRMIQKELYKSQGKEQI